MKKVTRYLIACFLVAGFTLGRGWTAGRPAPLVVVVVRDVSYA